MLSPRGSRWMQTFRKLPTMLPKTKNTTAQNSGGTWDQVSRSNMALIPIDIFGQRLAHDFERRGFARPQFQRARTLVQEHAEAVGGAAASGPRAPEQRRFGGAIDHVVNHGGPF